jgi:hypothetical protein
VTPDPLTRTVQDFLSEASGAVVLEDGAVAFDLGQAKYSISGDYNKCLLPLWSAERNTVRRVLDAEVKNGTLKLAVQRLGQPRPTRLEICRERDRRSPSVKKAARASYEQKLRSALDRHFPSFDVARLTTDVDSGLTCSLGGGPAHDSDKSKHSVRRDEVSHGGNSRDHGIALRQLFRELAAWLWRESPR